jgi:predicted PurR-regulated permease PerM
MIAPASPAFLQLLRLLQYGLVVLLMLYLGQSLFVPLSFALLISFILYPVCRWLEGRRLPRVVAIGLSLMVFFSLLMGVLGLLVWQFSLFARQWPALSTKVVAYAEQLSRQLGEVLGVTLEVQQEWLQSLLVSSLEGLLKGLPEALYTTSISLVLILLIPVYVAAILYYRDILVAALDKLAAPYWKGQLSLLLPQVIKTYANFIKGMALVYLLVGLLNSLGLALLGIPNPLFFGFVASILTFIPYVGIMVGALLPMAVAWLTYDSVWYPLGIVGVFALVQLIEANLIFPLAVSYKLKINALATLVVIVAGGILWGAAGMILFVPFIAILKLIADKVDPHSFLSLLLGTHSNLEKQKVHPPASPKEDSLPLPAPAQQAEKEPIAVNRLVLP